MNTTEKVKQIGLQFRDFILNWDSNPEHISAFPAHLPGCSQKKPLKINVEFKGEMPNWSNLGVNTIITGIKISCTECGGWINEKR